jgi:hypothetical protein
MHQGPRRGDPGCSVSWAYTGEYWNERTAGYSTSKQHGQMPSLPEWHCKESADMLETPRNRCTAAKLMLTADSRSDTSADSRAEHHLCQEYLPPKLVTLPKLNLPKSFRCRPDLLISIHPIPVLNLLLSMHMPRMPRTIQMLIQIC